MLTCDPPTREELTFGLAVRVTRQVRVLELERGGLWKPNTIGHSWDREWNVVVVCEERGAGCVQQNVRLACDADCEFCEGYRVVPFKQTESIACGSCKGTGKDRRGAQRVVEIEQEEFRALVAEGAIVLQGAK